MAFTQNWEAEFEGSPLNSAPITHGNEAIQDVKKAVRERMNVEHHMDPTEAYPQALHGQHKAGSAVSYYQELAPTVKPDSVSPLNAADNGRIWVKTTDKMTYVYVQGAGWVETLAYEAKIIDGTIPSVVGKAMLSAVDKTAQQALVSGAGLDADTLDGTHLATLTGRLDGNDTNLDTLNDFKTWDTGATYALDEPTFYSGVPYRSLVAANVGNNPSSSPTKWEVTGGGAGVASSPGYNFENGQFDAKLATGWDKYKDVAGSVPVDGMGGTATITFAHSTVNPLVGSGSGLLTKVASNKQGEGFSYDFSVDRGVLQDPCQLTFQYETGDGYVDGDMGVFLYDKTNNVIIPISVQSLPATYDKPASFKTVCLLSNSLTYRLIFHIASTSALAYTLKLDDVQIGSQTVAIGAAIGNWIDYTPVLKGTISDPTVTYIRNIGRYRRVGSTLEIYLDVCINTLSGGSGGLRYRLPIQGITISPEIPSSTITNGGDIAFWDASTNLLYKGNVLIPMGGDNTYLQFVLATGTSFSNLLFTSVGNGDQFGIRIYVPIAQWASNVNLASDFTEYAYNTSATITNDTTSFGYGPEGVNLRLFVPVGKASIIKRVNFKNAIQATDKIEFEAFVNEVWAPFANNAEFIGTFATNDAGTIYYGGALHPVDTFNVDVHFYSLPYAGAIGWPATRKWRVRKISNGNMAEVPNTTINPLTAAIGANTTYTIPFIPGERKIYIPKAFLKATTANTYALTITTGVAGKDNVTIPIQKSTDTITSGNLLAVVYIDYEGNVTADGWKISGSNSNGNWQIDAGGTMEQWGIGIAAYSSSNHAEPTVVYPIDFYAISCLTSSLLNHFGGISYVSQKPYYTKDIFPLTNQNTFLFIVDSGAVATGNLYFSWMAKGRWRA